MSKIKLYLEESYSELMNKVTWPSWSELQSSALIVATASALIAFSVFLMDFLVGIRPSDAIWRGILGFFYSLF